MFSLTVVDHVRLDSEQAARNYTVHARAAERMASLGFIGRLVITGLLAISTAAAVINLLSPGRVSQVAAVVASAAALFAFAAYGILGLEARLFAHRSFAHRLWLVSERYRSLLSEVTDGTVDGQTLLRRRDELLVTLHTIYEIGMGSDHAGYEGERLPTLPDERAA
jgi:conflict system pore-forming effector with SLATT domain